MGPFETLYEKKCNIPISWDNPTYIVVFGLKLLREMEEKMVNINHNLKAT
jgi:hypothetical protein